MPSDALNQGGIEDSGARDEGAFQRGYGSRSEEAAARVMRIGALVQLRLARALKHYGLSVQGHDVLRVLQDAGRPIAARRVADSISTAVPDVTRLIDRLQNRGLVERRKSEADRRVVLVALTDRGRGLLDETAAPVDSAVKQMMGRLKKGDRKDLVRILAKLDDPLNEQV